MAGETRGVKLSIRNVVKEYKGEHGTTVALNGVNLDVMENEFICVVGPSGCGKSTLLNILAGLHEAYSGECYLDGELIRGTDVKRGVVFQQYALFPWLTVLQNVMFGPQMKRLPKEQCLEIARKYIKTVGLEEFENSFPKELSGGMKQRVAIARAYAVNPSLLLMDEPFRGLDEATRAQVMELVRHERSAEGKLTLIVTHDKTEALALADSILTFTSAPASECIMEEITR